MPFKLESQYVLLDGNEFEALKETNTNRFYFAERVATRGILDFGLVKKGQSEMINLKFQADTPIIIDSIVALSDQSTADEITFTLWKEVDGEKVIVGKQRYSNAEMPVDFPDGIIFPDMSLEVSPLKADSRITVYVKPVKVLFTARPPLTTSTPEEGGFSSGTA